MTSAARPSSSSNTWSNRTVRSDIVTSEYTNSSGLFNTSVPSEGGDSGSSTIFFLSGTNTSSNTGASSALVNGSTVKSNVIYSALGAGSGDAVSCAVSNVPISAKSIFSVSATFPVGTGSNVLTSNSIFIVPGTWRNSNPVTVAQGATATITVPNGSIVIYSCGDVADTSAITVTVTTGTLIGRSKVNWYDGVEHGLVYSQNGNTVVLTPPASSNSAITYSILTMS